jgi:hypothetical protein
MTKLTIDSNGHISLPYPAVKQIGSRPLELASHSGQYLSFFYVFRDTSLRENSTLDGDRILANLAGLEEEDKKKLLADALSELVYMECIFARRELGAVESAELIRRVQEISWRMKSLVGRAQ